MNERGLITGSRYLIAVGVGFLLTTLSSCGGGGDSREVESTPPPAPPPPPVFTPGTTFFDGTGGSNMIRSFEIIGEGTTDVAEIGGGLAAADIDDDGDIDMYVVGGNGMPNSMYRNEGNNVFVDVASEVGLDITHLGSGPAFGDIDGDNDLDLFVGAVEGDPVYLFRNDGLTFTDITATSGLNLRPGNTVSASFSDYDLDNDLDLVLAHWGNDPEPDTETIWQNNGDGTFVTASIPSGIAENLIIDTGNNAPLFDFTFAPMLSDIDRDGDPDLLFAADFKTGRIFLNNGDGTFSDITDNEVVIDRNGMGGAAGDYDNDGDMDWFVTSIFEVPSISSDPNPGNRLYRNEGGGVFSDVTAEADVADGGWGWAVCMEDFDNDGDLDIFHVNGWEEVDPREEAGVNDYTFDQVRYFENVPEFTESQGIFIEAADQMGLVDNGQGRGVVCFDSDRDGDVDLVITNNQVHKGIVFYRNELDNNNIYLNIRLLSNTLNSKGVGAFIQIDDGNLEQVREIRAGNHFVSQNPAEAHFGLGGQTSADITVYWPDGSTSTMINVSANQEYVITQ